VGFLAHPTKLIFLSPRVLLRARLSEKTIFYDKQKNARLIQRVATYSRVYQLKFIFWSVYYKQNTLPTNTITFTYRWSPDK
ncbi:hypothetical protein ACVGWK_04065, partial [Enterobacter sichuanensis]